MDENTVVVTGVGLVTAAGDACQTWHAIKNGCSAVSWVDLDAGANYPARLPGAIIEHDYWPDGLSKPKRFRSLPEVAKISLVAAYEAVTAARTGGRNPFVNAHRVGVIMGTSLAAAELGIQNHLFVLEGQDSRYLIHGIQALPNMLGFFLSNLEGGIPFTGPNLTVSGACAAGLQAVGLGRLLLQTGVVDTVLVGGVDYLFRTDFPSALLTFNSIGVLGNPTDPEKPWTACRPFAGGPENGFILGNAAGVLVLERAEDALATNANIAGTIDGFAQGIDPSSPAKPDEDATQAKFVIRQALINAGLESGDIDFVIPHGVGTIGDQTEALALCQEIGYGMPVTSNKPICGHTMAASGIIGLTTAFRAIEEGILPPTLNHAGGTSMGLEIPKKMVGGYDIRHVLINAFGLGGQLASIIVSGKVD
ncbi:hypothetical protein KC571_03935 [candidate division WWE3 bacterium]|uniref:Ketosynthase family 3 (KS3) domain-containing protein n=1 Tax=candidate division WWE3 bacterium TaxID=2053526 RepID=A0A955LH97_UNCKA|nr:hypothetical protein [candidate division WWE3 bacterium]